VHKWREIRLFQKMRLGIASKQNFTELRGGRPATGRSMPISRATYSRAGMHRAAMHPQLTRHPRCSGPDES
jgi:hypothetical protein